MVQRDGGGGSRYSARVCISAAYDVFKTGRGCIPYRTRGFLCTGGPFYKRHLRVATKEEEGSQKSRGAFSVSAVSRVEYVHRFGGTSRTNSTGYPTEDPPLIDADMYRVVELSPRYVARSFAITRGGGGLFVHITDRLDQPPTVQARASNRTEPTRTTHSARTG